jgi:pimeloyl-ACP methyl ester carboxylesterase
MVQPITYFVAYGGQHIGPLTREQLQTGISRAEITMDVPCWVPGMSHWRPLSEVAPDLAMFGPAAPPAFPAFPVQSEPIVRAESAVPSRREYQTILPPHKLPKHLPEKRQGNTGWIIGVVLLVAIYSILRLPRSGAVGTWLTKYGIIPAKIMSTTSRSEPTHDQDSMKTPSNDARLSGKPLFADRKEHQTVWQKCEVEGAGPADEPDEQVFSLIHYTSSVGPLAAYVTPDPGDGKKHPAIVWAHGGYGGIGSYFWEECSKDNDQSARAFREKGIAMMVPSWRGENDNPGRFELFYGEVEDLIAAIEHIKTLPYIDANRVYVGGHSTGGTNTLLAAFSSLGFRAAFSFGGILDAEEVNKDPRRKDRVPYDQESVRDHQLRSPMRYASYALRPVFYFEGEDYYDSDSAEIMASVAHGKFHPFSTPGDHFALLHPITHLIADKILADTGADTAITFTSEELAHAYAKAFR